MKKYLSIFTVLSLLLIPLLNFAQGDLKQDFFWVAFDESGMIIPQESSGTMDDPMEDGTWYYYDNYGDPWWNIWFFDHPFDVTRYKDVYMEFWIYPLVAGTPTDVEIVVNWSTQFWPPDGAPPLPGLFPPEDENLVLSRSETIFSLDGVQLDPLEGLFYQMPEYFNIPWYNPEWVSIDIRGSNFQILPPVGPEYPSGGIDGQWSEINHWCLPKDPPPPPGQENEEMGDAPEGVQAYINPSTLGHFPTCKLNGPATSFISHTWPGTAWFGGYADAEGNGNHNFCDPYSLPYDQDECGNNLTFDPTLDEGLMFPSPYTISAGLYQPCSGVIDTLAPPCTYITWGGQDIDIWIQTTTAVYLNVLFDWDQDGDWGGTSNCPSWNTNEHVLDNFVIPANTNGPLSWVPNIIPGFVTGPNEGYVWVRFSLTDQPVPFDWDGHGVFGDGETEDYLLLIATPQDPPPPNIDMGDAPEDDGDGLNDALAYIPSTLGNFPTCITNGTAESYISHMLGTAWFGGMVDAEGDGNSGICPYVFPYNNDECGTFPYPIPPPIGPTGLDEGLIFPPSYTITGSSGSETYEPCTQGEEGALGDVCTAIVWGTDIDIWVQTPTDIYLNVLFDWDQDGDWGGSSTCTSGTVDEHVLQNFLVPAGTNGPISAELLPDFMTGPNEGYVWARFSLTEVPVSVDWDGHGFFENGETEDYLLLITSPEEIPLNNWALIISIILIVLFATLIWRKNL